MLGNVKVNNPDLTKHLLTVSICMDRRWFHLARYHDSEYRLFGPKALGEFLGLSIDDVFPIRYDISAHCIGHRDSLVNLIEKSPAVRLSRTEIIRLAVPRNPDH